MPLPQEQFERHLWGAADILRGRIDADDYKHYIFGLLFFKRLSDVWWEEYEDRLERYDGSEDLAADPDEDRFHIPEGHFWEDVRRKTTDIGFALNNAAGSWGGRVFKNARQWRAMRQARDLTNPIG